MSIQPARLDRERHTIVVMIGLYCRAHHNAEEIPCATCRDLHSYAMQRIDKCPYGTEKTTCAKCPIHCYKPALREQIRQVMRYAGPRMLLRHPVLTIMHYWDEMSRQREAYTQR